MVYLVLFISKACDHLMLPFVLVWSVWNGFVYKNSFDLRFSMPHFQVEYIIPVISHKNQSRMIQLFFLALLPLALGQTPTTTSPPQFTIPCDMITSTKDCPSSMPICTPTSVCSDGLSRCTGVCITTPPPLPTSGCYIGSPFTTCQALTETCAPFYSTCASSGCLGTCVPRPTPPPTATCVVNGYPSCSASSTCTPTESSTPGLPWHGVCITSSPQPPPTSCVVSGTPSCSSPATCTPTEISTPGQPWHGVCITASNPPPNSCVMTGTPTCSTPLTCTPTETSTPGQPWHGVCVTPVPPGPTSACLVSNTVTSCSKPTETCAPFSSTCTTSNCLGTCVATPSPTPTGCRGHHDCKRGQKCVRKPGSHCSPGPYCEGICQRR
jgi:hypothetical protein